MLSAKANAQLAPEYLKGATVTVKLANGTTYEYKSEDMAVVPRKNLNINAAKVAGFDKLHKKVVDKELVKNRKNRVYGLAGYGPTGDLKVSTNGSTYETKHRKGVVGGIGYQRKVTEKVNVGVQVQTNDTSSLSLGFDF
jgi:hypothetical protein